MFLKKSNKKEDIFLEAVDVEKNCLNHKDFIKKYQFTYMIVYKNSRLYNYLKKNNTKIIFSDKEYVIFEL